MKPLNLYESKYGASNPQILSTLPLRILSISSTCMQPRGVVDGEAAKLKVIEGDIAGAICLAEESCPDIFEASLPKLPLF